MRCWWSQPEYRGEPEDRCTRGVVVKYDPEAERGPSMDSMFCPLHLVRFDMMRPGWVVAMERRRAQSGVSQR